METTNCTRKPEDIEKEWSMLGFPSWVWGLVKDLDQRRTLDAVRMYEVKWLIDAVSQQKRNSTLNAGIIELADNSVPKYWKEKIFDEVRKVLFSRGYIRGHYLGGKYDNLRRFVLLRAFVLKLSSKKEYYLLNYTRRKDLERIIGELYDYYRKNYSDYKESSLEVIFDCLTAYLPPEQKKMINWYCSSELGCNPVLTTSEEELEEALYRNMVLYGLPKLEMSIDDGVITIS
jgi:hypothetical protein